MDDLHDLLRAGDRLKHAFADRALANCGDELAHDLQVHVGFEKSDANVAQRLVEIRLADARTAAKPLERVVQTVRKLLEHHTRL